MTASRPGGRSARVRQAVLEAVLDELAEHGDAGFSMERVAFRAGVNKTSIYRRWGDRGALLIDALQLAPADELPPEDTGSLRGDLLALGRSLVAYFVGSDRAAAVTRVVVSSADPAIRAARFALLDRRRDNLALVCERAIARGEIDEADPDLLFEVLYGAGQLHGQRDPRGDALAYVEQLTDFVVRALGVAPTPSQG